MVSCRWVVASSQPPTAHTLVTDVSRCELSYRGTFARVGDSSPHPFQQMEKDGAPDGVKNYFFNARGCSRQQIVTRRHPLSCVQRSLYGKSIDGGDLFPWTRSLFEYQRRPANALTFKVHGHLDSIGDPDEWNAFVHSEVFAVECHRPLDLA